jgi:hypothetical protein
MPRALKGVLGANGSWQGGCEIDAHRRPDQSCLPPSSGGAFPSFLALRRLSKEINWGSGALFWSYLSRLESQADCCLCSAFSSSAPICPGTHFLSIIITIEGGHSPRQSFMSRRRMTPTLWATGISSSSMSRLSAPCASLHLRDPAPRGLCAWTIPE